MIPDISLSPLTRLYMILFMITLGTMSLTFLSYDAAAQTDFDHFTTGFPLEGRHKALECDSCHVNGSFKGTPKICIS
jgi:hypothetical protein